MKKDRFKAISIIVVIAILIMILAQGYWNYQSYVTNKTQFHRDIQVALDNSVEAYYADLAKVNMMAMVSDDSLDVHVFQHDTMIWQDRPDTMVFAFHDSKVMSTNIRKLKFSSDSQERRIVRQSRDGSFTQINRFNLHDSVELKIEDLAAKIVVSLESDDVDFAKLKALLSDELGRKQLSINHTLQTTFSIGSEPPTLEIEEPNVIYANTSYLPPGMSVVLSFEHATVQILKRGLVGLMISLVITGMLIYVLYYLYRTIKDQKELAEIKNDLISNITHEFKTPIATISTALEGISKFNQDGDQQKTEKYLSISGDQLSKLNGMVEQLLETATMEGNDWQLHKEEVEFNGWMIELIEKYRVRFSDKIIDWTGVALTLSIDKYVMESVVGNLLDNAGKYGGERIAVSLTTGSQSVKIEVCDNGVGIDKSQQDKIFEKFYRVPTGNTHDVKGYGIGLFQAQKGVERHGGSLVVSSRPGNTCFIITLPNES
ncbi:MAG: HAMP domain-containing histidine kinase [Cyclobacteriaceae bacterium]